MESEKSGFVNKMSEIWRKMQVKLVKRVWKWFRSIVLALFYVLVCYSHPQISDAIMKPSVGDRQLEPNETVR